MGGLCGILQYFPLTFSFVCVVCWYVRSYTVEPPSQGRTGTTKIVLYTEVSSILSVHYKRFHTIYNLSLKKYAYLMEPPNKGYIGTTNLSFIQKCPLY